MNSELTTWLEYAKLQLASEAFITHRVTGLQRFSGPALQTALIEGNDHASRFTPTEAAAFTNRYEVVAHEANTGTGFSGTLFWDTEKLEYTLSFRSTEFVEDALADSVGTNEGIAEYGWAFGQIADMEDWWAQLNQDIPGLAGKQVTVTGYSLGGHLATAFAQLRAEAGELARINHIYTFNGAGTGGILPGHSLTEVMALFRSVRDTGELPGWLNNLGDIATLRSQAQSRLDDILGEKNTITGYVSGLPGGEPLQPRLGDFADLGLHFAMAVAGEWTTGATQESIDPDTLQAVFDPQQAITGGMQFNGLMTELLGSGISAVAVTGLRHSDSRTQIKIEDQPMLRGTPTRATPPEIRLTDRYALNDIADTHSLVLIIDSLAVLDTLARLDQNPARIDNDFATALIEAASGRVRDTLLGDQGQAEGDPLENLVDALHRLFVGTDSGLRNNPLILQGGHWADEPLRNAFHQALHDITDSPLYQQSIGLLNVTSLAGMNAGTVAAQAKQDTADGLAYRYALEQLNPFVLTGDADIYAAHNGDGHLNADQFSDLYLQDRAAMLGWLLHDLAPVDTPLGETYFKLGQFGDRYYFQDVTSHTQIRLGETVDLLQPPTDFRHIVFGTDDGETLVGEAKSDHLYGNAGDDVLNGGDGADHLEGGKGDDTLYGGFGNDILVGGQGLDTYRLYANEGIDTILDSDGQGKLLLGGIEARGKTGLPQPGDWLQLSLNAWEDRRNGIAYTLIPQTDGSQHLRVAGQGGNALIKNWHVGDLSIDLAAGAPPETALTLTGDLAPIDADASQAGIQEGHDALGNAIVGNGAAPGRADALYDSVGNDVINGLAGDDELLASRGGDDILDGGSGQDRLDGGAGRDSLIGGAGSDVLQGGADADQLFAEDSVEDLAQHLLAGETQAGTGLRGDWLDGGQGDDILAGEAGNDILLGGEGQDLLIGSAGDDHIHGDASGSAARDWQITRDTIVYSDHTAYVPVAEQGTWWAAQTGAADVLYGGAGDDWIYGEQGNDMIDAGNGNDVVWGGEDDDVVLGGAGDDAIAGDGGYSVVPRQGNDLLFGGDGDDTYPINGESNDLLPVAFDTLAASPILGDAAEAADKPLRGRCLTAPRHIVNGQNTYYFRQIVRMKRAA